ncbi:MAG: type 3 dihydrofolate reductase, partial [Candidatus Competibacterales bacterium]|nr:type 3 dihydrofolate reductase [Candidatus Competibacterales bacterium]
MILSLVVAMAENRVIGHDGGMPWHLPADLRHFRQLTLGRPVVMGRRTHESIGRPLPGRHNIVLSRRPGYRAEGCTVVASLAQAEQMAGEVEELMIIGGGELYRQALPRARRIYLTEVHARPEGTVRFPELDRSEWRELRRETHPADDRHPHPYSFVWLERCRAGHDDAADGAHAPLAGRRATPSSPERTRAASFEGTAGVPPDS